MRPGNRSWSAHPRTRGGTALSCPPRASRRRENPGRVGGRFPGLPSALPSLERPSLVLPQEAVVYKSSAPRPKQYYHPGISLGLKELLEPREPKLVPGIRNKEE